MKKFKILDCTLRDGGYYTNWDFKSQLVNKLDNVGDEQLNIKFDEDDRLRTLKHSKKVRNTLGKFRTAVVKNHLHNIENCNERKYNRI